jgi:hypothetical protein
MMKHKYFGCDCFCLNHIASLGYFPPEEGEEIDDEDNEIYLTVKTDYLYKNIVPPIDPRDLEYYFRFHILKRVPIALGYVFNNFYTRKYGVMDCFDFREQDLPEIKEFLSNLSDVESEANLGSNLTIDNDKWLIRFVVEKFSEDMPHWLGWELQFKARNIWGRIGYALKYLFGKVEDEQYFNINQAEVEHLNGLISAIEKANKKDEQRD